MTSTPRGKAALRKALLGHLPGREVTHAVTMPADGDGVSYCGAERSRYLDGRGTRRLVITGDLRNLRDVAEVDCQRCLAALRERGLA